MITPNAILAIEEARRDIRARKGTPDYDPVTAREQLRQLDGLEAAELADAEKDGLRPEWADLERRYFMACESARHGLAGVPLPRAIRDADRARRFHDNTRPNSGVAFHKGSGKYWAYRPIGGKRRHSLGYYPTKGEAEAAVQRDRRRQVVA